MIRALTQDDCTAALEAWDACYSPKHRICPRLFAQHAFQDPHALPEGCLFHPPSGTWVTAKVPLDPPLWEGMPPDVGWIGALAAPDPAIADALLDHAEKALRSAGMSEVCFGSDPNHIYPGPPEEEPWLTDLLAARGYQLGEPVYDLFAPMEVLPVRPSHPEAGPVTAREVEGLLAFVGREFPGRWLAETEHRLRVEDAPSFAVAVRDAGKIVAFVHASTLQHRHLAGNLSFHLALGGNPGGIGNVGVAASYRGRGLGRAVMEAAIEVLRAKGVTGISVDWTGLLGFYGKMGFAVRTSYRLCRKRLAE
ncbi:MAG: GNAT family N-acetyltransferase [Fimbriimonadia bacterium]